MPTSTSIRLDDATLARLDAVAKETGKSRSQAMAEAVNQYLDYNEWFLASVQEGIRAADAGEFASPEKVRETFRKWGVDVD